MPVAVPVESADPFHKLDDVAKPTHQLADPECRIYVGDCRQLLPRIPEVRDGQLDLVFADPPFTWNRAYDQWDDAMPREDYLQFTYDWLDMCSRASSPPARCG